MTSDDAGARSSDPGPIETGPVTKRAPGEGITISGIHNSGVAIGPDVQVSVTPHQPSSAQRVAAELLSDFIRQLPQFDDSIEDPADIRDLAEAAQAEILKPSPRRPVVRHLLEVISARVAGVSTLADAINNIQELVARMF